jgi:hypothetical protein
MSEKFYGVESWKTWCTSSPRNLSPTKCWSTELRPEEAEEVTQYKDLVKIASFLAVMNKADRPSI